MSWTQRFGGGLGRFSPFTRSPPQGSTKQPAEADYGPPRDTDVLILRNKKKEYAVHFPAYSIAKGELTVGKVRDQAAKATQSDARRIKLLYKGKNLKDDSRLCLQEGLQDGAELMCAIAEGMTSPSDSEESDDEFANGTGTADGEAKRRRNRGKKSKRRNKRDQAGTSTPQAGEPPLGMPSNGQHASRTQSPRPPATPATPLDKLNALHQKLQDFVPDCEKFLASPPTEPAKKDFEHKRLTETILTHVLLKTDGVETEGDEEARARRKALVKETQAWLNRLDAARNS